MDFGRSEYEVSYPSDQEDYIVDRADGATLFRRGKLS